MSNIDPTGDQGQPAAAAAAAATVSSVEFKAIKMGIRPVVRITPGGVAYERRFANWLTWTLVVLTGGAAAFGWPWILFGKRQVMIPRAQIQGVELQQGTSWATLVVRSMTDTVRFRTDVAVAEQAQQLLMG